MSFSGLDTTGIGLEQAKLETGPEWLSFAHETNQFHWGAVLIVSH